MGCVVTKTNKVEDESNHSTPRSRPATPHTSGGHHCWGRPESSGSDKEWETGKDGLSPDE